MKGKTSDKERLLHIKDAVQSIVDFTDGIGYEEYMADLKLRLALVKLLEIIGEAAGGISKETKKQFEEVEWNLMKGARNILIHEYFGIDYKIVWNTIRQHIPELKDKINNILSSFE